MSDRYIVLTMRNVNDETHTSLRAAEDAARSAVSEYGSGRVIAKVVAVFMPGAPFVLDDFQMEREFVQAEQRRSIGRTSEDTGSERSR